MNKRPKIRPVLSTADKLLNIITLLIVLSLWVLVVYRFSSQPYISTIFKLPAIGTSIFIVLSILNRFPHLFNYPLPITEKNAAKNYALATTTIRMLIVILVLIILLLYYNDTVAEPMSQINKWMQVLIMLVSPFIPVAYYLIRFSKVNKIG